jgi:hypothetical protein
MQNASLHFLLDGHVLVSYMQPSLPQLVNDQPSEAPPKYQEVQKYQAMVKGKLNERGHKVAYFHLRDGSMR